MNKHFISVTLYVRPYGVDISGDYYVEEDAVDQTVKDLKRICEVFSQRKGPWGFTTSRLNDRMCSHYLYNNDYTVRLADIVVNSSPRYIPEDTILQVIPDKDFFGEVMEVIQDIINSDDSDNTDQSKSRGENVIQ